MKSVFIGDVHHEIYKAERIINSNPDADEYVFVGDFFDTFDKEAPGIKVVAKKLKEWLSNPKFKICFGNHDLHYFADRNKQVRGSGFTKSKAEKINRILTRSDWEKFKFFYETQGFLCSHAGVDSSFIPEEGWTKEFQEKSTKEAFDSLYKTHWIWKVGFGRGGDYIVGGPLWLDWFAEFIPVKGLNQIVGHTKVLGVMSKGGEQSINWNIDCLPKQYLVITDGEAEIRESS